VLRVRPQQLVAEVLSEAEWGVIMQSSSQFPDVVASRFLSDLRRGLLKRGTNVSRKSQPMRSGIDKCE
jgi:hypothetical protein